MARYRPRSRFVVPLIISLFGLTMFYTSNIEQSVALRENNNQDRATAFIEGAVLTEYSETGEVKLRVEAARAFYFESKNLIKAESPHIDYLNETGQKIQLTAESGSYSTISELLTLQNKVEFERFDPENGNLVMLTEDLEVDAANDFISTTHDVTIRQNNHTLSSLGIQASLNDKRIELPAKVRGTYDVRQ
jgi:lipopolysaccharide export system protein LptC